jgi:hypothetical protein
MSPEDWELFRAATDQDVHLTKTRDDAWEVGMMPNLGLLTNESARQAETFLSGDRIRLPNGREFKRVMTTAEAREAFGLDPIADLDESASRDHEGNASIEEPNRVTTIQRPFHWGIVVVVGDDWGGESEVPAFDPDRIVAANDFAVTISVRHAQDTDEVETGDDGVEYVKLAEATVVARLLDASPTGEGRREVFSGVIAVPSGRLSIGDADEETIVTAHQGDNRVRVSVDDEVPADDLSPDLVYVDLLPALN